jgi:TatA/E family protein of Tat protein translocase
MPQIGPLEIGIVVLIALMVFGPNRLPEIARQAGGAWRELRRVQQNLRDDLHDMIHDEPSTDAPRRRAEDRAAASVDTDPT